MYINNIPLDTFGAKLLADYSVSDTPVTQGHTKSRTGLTFTPLGAEYGLKTINLPFTLQGESAQDARIKKSKLDALAASGKVELYLPDGFFYTSILQSTGTVEQILPNLLSGSYTFTGFCHGKLQEITTTGGPFYVDGTYPKMECILSTISTLTTADYAIGDVVFYHVKSKDKIVIDGMTKRILYNGASGAQRCSLVEFPSLSPGWNQIACPSTLRIKYYPIYL